MAAGKHVDRGRLRVKVVGTLSWCALVVLLVQALRVDGAPAATMLGLGPLALVVTYAITSAWVWHNKQIFVRKGARKRALAQSYPWTRDRLGRVYAGTRAPICGGTEVVLALEGSTKTYR